MPTTLHPQAKFDPIPPNLDLHGLVDRTPNFKWVQRVSRNQIRNLGPQEFEQLALIHVILGGKPLVVDGWDALLSQDLFSARWLEQTYDKKQENVRDIGNASDVPMTTGHYLRSMKQLAGQWSPTNFRDERRQRLYLKDIDCPEEWQNALQKVIHPGLWYLNEDASRHEKKQDTDEVFGHEASAAPAGDLMSSLPEPMRAQNLMCYIGHEGTYTPAHREMCASLGQNIMVETSKDENGEKAGSSIWFMTESKDREVVREYFLSMLGHDIEIEKHFAQVNAWKKAPFDVYIVEQKQGDFILIPPLAAHQVWNRGTRTMKVAWNRTTPETLELAIHEALPKARLVCRDEQYKNKAILYYTLSKYYGELQALEEDAELAQMSFIGLGQDIVRNSPRARRLAEDFKKLFSLFTEILVDEMFAHKEQNVEFLEFDSCVTCSYCRSNIFNRFLTCKHCVRTLITGDEDAYDICMECYAMGRSCLCLSGLKWCEQWSWSDLVNNYERWRAMIIKSDGFVDFETSPQPLEVARQRSRKKTVAQICQEGLRRRPFKDITKPDIEKRDEPSESEPDAGAERPKKKKRKQKKGELRRCHVCCHKDYSYRVHMCTNPGCQEGYCYGVLYRAFDMVPQTVQQDEQWQCPKCQGICNCGGCRRTGNTDPYTPKNTLLGHVTRAVADDRSVEALVDFRIHNLSWLKATGEESRTTDSRRLQRLKEQADSAKAQHSTAHEDYEDGAGAKDTGAEGDPSEGGAASPTAHRVRDDQQPDATMDDVEGLQHLRDAVMQDSTGVASEGHVVTIPNEDASISSYPDPTALARQRIGMGYYEQDDTPDKILFDPYQAPSADALRPEEPEIPDFVKKSLRAAKRKARRANDDDPDFVVGGRNHNKKPRAPRPSGEDFLDNMDPALFSTFPTVLMADMGENGENGEAAGHPADPTAQPENATDAMGATGTTSGPGTGRRQQWFEANEPELRHAQPKVSYIEPEDIEMDESDQVVLRRSPPPNGEGDESLDLAADAVRRMMQKRQPVMKDGVLVMPRRPGRPPKQPKPAGDGGSDSGDAEPPPPKPSPKRRHTRTSRLAAGLSEEEDQEVSEATREKERHSPRPKRRARPSGITTVSAASAAWDESSEEEAEAEASPAPPQSAPASGKRGRGRPRKLKTAAAEPSPPSAGLQFMSMADRMAMKGKKFKIAKRKSHVNEDTPNQSKSTVDAAASEQLQVEAEAEAEAEDAEMPDKPVSDGLLNVDDNDEDMLDAVSETSIAASRPSTIPIRAPSGRTVVRLADADNEDEPDTFTVASPSGSEVSSDDDMDDIPASGRGAASSGRRGRGRSVRGRGRGRPRGRPRGRQRVH